MITIRPATETDCIYVGLNLREADRQEAATVNNGLLRPLGSLVEGYRNSSMCLTVWEVWDGTVIRGPIGMFGVIPSPDGRGFVWFLGTDDVTRHSLAVIREAPLWLDFMARQFPKGLYTNADERNTLHIQWCLKVGFKRNAAGDITIGGQPFLRLERPNRHV